MKTVEEIGRKSRGGGGGGGALTLGEKVVGKGGSGPNRRPGESRGCRRKKGGEKQMRKTKGEGSPRGPVPSPMLEVEESGENTRKQWKHQKGTRGKGGNI